MSFRCHLLQIHTFNNDEGMPFPGTSMLTSQETSKWAVHMSKKIIIKIKLCIYYCTVVI